MANFLAELKRRNVFRVGAAYAVVAWISLQLVNNLTPALRLPEWASSFVVVLLIVGLPVALIFTWARELPLEAGATPQAANTRLDWFLSSALVVVFALVLYQQLAPSGATQSQQAGVDLARAASARQAGAISIAVLPFSNLSGDTGQEFFSDGMTEEITTALARISDLRVVARTSAFQYKGQNQDMRAVGQALGATHLIEGSVRKEGNQLRITAQLIQADNGVHVWAENYNRELTSVFAIQEDIATAIAGALRMPLGLKPGERLVSSRTIDPESYQQYLRAKPLVRALGRGVPQAIEILEPLVARNPDYAPAWAQLSHAYSLTPNYHRNGTVAELRRIVEEFLPKSEVAAQRAVQLDEGLADGYVALGRYQARRGKYLLAEELFSKALALDPNNPDALNQYGSMLAVLGRLKESLAMRQQMLALEPEIIGFKIGTAELLWLNGQDDAAIAMLTGLPSVAANAGASLARIYAALGRFGEAADALRVAPPGTTPPEVLATAASFLRTAPAHATSPQNLPPLGTFGFVYLYIGAPGRALENHEGTTEAGYLSASGTFNAFLWHPTYAALRKTERFKAWVRAEGYVDYWLAKGWPEFCRPTNGSDFVCS